MDFLLNENQCFISFRIPELNLLSGRVASFQICCFYKKGELREPVTFFHGSQQGEKKKTVPLLLKIEKDAREWHPSPQHHDLKGIFTTKKNMDKFRRELARGGRGLFITGICFATPPVPERHSIPGTAPSLFIVRN